MSTFATEITNDVGNTFKLGDSVQHWDGTHYIVVSIRIPPKFARHQCVELGVLECGTEFFKWYSMGNFTHINSKEVA